MILSFKDILSKYNLKPKGILHVGAHRGEELEDYINVTDNIILIEAIKDAADYLKERCKVFKRVRVHNVCVSDCEEDVNFYITNNGQSSSFLELGTHKQEHPDVYVTRIEKMRTQRIDKLVDNADGYFVNLDLQGAELKALRGMGELLHGVIAVYSEVNVKELYKGCALMDELDAYLSTFGFKRVETQISGHGWGDALYLK